MHKTITLQDVKATLSADTYSVKHGVFTVRRGFFYTSGRTEEDFVREVRAAFPTAVVLEAGEVWKAFRGGAAVAQSSHWFVRFSVKAAQ